ncbi:MAG: vitamin K epoxide reductase family protein [Chloroflexi bacterium]|nr:vitamin K epoxide reductase family protein [Chloroflexota bacterium]
MAERRIPPGWEYNPSNWGNRLPIIGLALVGTAIAAYLSAFQLGLIDTVWEPFFGDGSRTILTSRISHVLPIPDAALGAGAYLIDAVAGAVGGRSRWRTMPWIVLLFGLAVGPLGIVSITLVVLQPVMFDAWCTLCLASALVSLAMIGPAFDEVLASLQHLRRVHDQGGSYSRALWSGEGGAE